MVRAGLQLLTFFFFLVPNGLQVFGREPRDIHTDLVKNMQIPPDG